jgi:hypothetical protein
MCKINVTEDGASELKNDLRPYICHLVKKKKYQKQKRLASSSSTQLN